MPEGNENQAVTQEEYDALKAELEAEKAKAQEAVAQATTELTQRITSLETSLAGKDEELTTLKNEAEVLSGAKQSLQAQHEGAVNSYRELVLSSNPLLPADMVQGGTIDEINASVEKATALVGQIKQGLEASQQAQAQATNVPAGAPGRSAPDLSAMSTREKINYGLQQARKEK